MEHHRCSNKLKINPLAENVIYFKNIKKQQEIFLKKNLIKQLNQKKLSKILKKLMKLKKYYELQFDFNDENLEDEEELEHTKIKDSLKIQNFINQIIEECAQNNSDQFEEDLNELEESSENMDEEEDLDDMESEIEIEEIESEIENFELENQIEDELEEIEDELEEIADIIDDMNEQIDEVEIDEIEDEIEVDEIEDIIEEMENVFEEDEFNTFEDEMNDLEDEIEDIADTIDDIDYQIEEIEDKIENDNTEKSIGLDNNVDSNKNEIETDTIIEFDKMILNKNLENKSKRKNNISFKR